MKLVKTKIPTLKEFKAMRQITRKAFENNQDRQIAFISVSYFSLLLKMFFCNWFYFLYEKNRIIAIATIRNRSLTLFAVSPKYQKKGIGSMFLNSIEDDLKEHGKTEIILWAGEKYEYYLKRGYKPFYPNKYVKQL